MGLPPIPLKRKGSAAEAEIGVWRFLTLGEREPRVFSRLGELSSNIIIVTEKVSSL